MNVNQQVIMKKIAQTISLVLAYSSLTSALFASVLHEFNFDEPQGTDLTDTVNTGLSNDNWHQGVPSATTTGNGTLRITADIGDDYTNSRVNIGDIQGADSIYFSTRFNSWDLSNSGSVAMRLSLMNNILPDEGSQITAESRFRSRDGMIQMQAQGLGGGESGAWQDLFPLILNDPLQIVVEHNKAQQQYGVFYQFGDNAWEEFFSGALSETRDAGSMRLVFAFIDGEDFIEVDSVSVSTVNPIPEPRTYALLFGFGALAFVLARRLKVKS